MTTSPRRRRRASRPSTATEYDRTADRPVQGQSAVDVGDGLRDVVLDDEELIDEPLTGAARYEDERPPHYGGD